MSSEERLAQIEQTLEAIRTGWPFFLAVLQDRANTLTVDLVNQDNEQTRGRVKALHELMQLPASLQSEREGISAGLAEQAPAN